MGSAVLAAVPGLIDYVFAVPPRSSAKDRATKHLLTNMTALALFTAARAGGNGRRRPSAWSIAAEVTGAGLLAVGGWLGGTLVFRNQIAVDHRYADAGKWQPLALPPAETGAEIDLGADDQLGVDQMKLLRLGDRRLVLARTETGYVAFDDRCTHKGGPLSDGTLACGIVQCPWHGSQFDVHTGAVRHGPAQEHVGVHEITAHEGRLRLRLRA
jgi:nitrite reductase/ring-hydroxylating ferredoxin subunit